MGEQFLGAETVWEESGTMNANLQADVSPRQVRRRIRAMLLRQARADFLMSMLLRRMAATRKNFEL